MNDRLAVGLGLEMVPGAGKFSAQLLEVFDDAVVYEDDAVIGVWMRIYLVGRAMCGPTGVADPDHALHGLVRQQGLKSRNLAFRTPALNGAIEKRRDACGIVAPVLKPPEPVDQERGDLLLANDANDAAHRRSALRIPPPLTTLGGANHLLFRLPA